MCPTIRHGDDNNVYGYGKGLMPVRTRQKLYIVQQQRRTLPFCLPGERKKRESSARIALFWMVTDLIGRSVNTHRSSVEANQHIVVARRSQRPIRGRFTRMPQIEIWSKCRRWKWRHQTEWNRGSLWQPGNKDSVNAVDVATPIPEIFEKHIRRRRQKRSKLWSQCEENEEFIVGVAGEGQYYVSTVIRPRSQDSTIYFQHLKDYIRRHCPKPTTEGRGDACKKFNWRQKTWSFGDKDFSGNGIEHMSTLFTRKYESRLPDTSFVLCSSQSSGRAIEIQNWKKNFYFLRTRAPQKSCVWIKIKNVCLNKNKTCLRRTIWLILLKMMMMTFTKEKITTRSISMMKYDDKSQSDEVVDDRDEDNKDIDTKNLYGKKGKPTRGTKMKFLIQKNIWMMLCDIRRRTNAALVDEDFSKMKKMKKIREIWRGRRRWRGLRRGNRALWARPSPRPRAQARGQSAQAEAKAESKTVAPPPKQSPNQ